MVYNLIKDHPVVFMMFIAGVGILLDNIWTEWKAKRKGKK